MGSTTSTARAGKSKPAADSDKLLATPSSAHRHNITCMKFFGKDQELLLTASEDRTLRIWDFGKENRFGHVWELNGLLDKHSRAATKANEEAGLGKVAALRCPLEAHAGEGHQHWVTCFDVDERSSVVYSGSMDKTVKAWDMYTGRCMRTYSGHGDWVLSVHVRGRMVYSAAEDGCVRLWKLSTLLKDGEEAGAEEGGCWEAHDAAIKATVLAGDFLLTGDLQGWVKYWNLMDGSCEVKDKTGVGVVTSLAAPYHEAELEAVRMREEGKESVRRISRSIGSGAGVTVFVGGANGVVEWREVVNNQREDAVIVEYRHKEGGAVTAMQVVDGTLFTGSEDKTVRAWAVESGDCVQMYVGPLSPVRDLVVLPERGLLCSAASDLRLWDLNSGDVVEVLHWKKFEAVAVAPGGGCVIGGCAGQLRCYGIGERGRHRGGGEEKQKGGVAGVMRPLLGTVRPRTPPEKGKGRGMVNGGGSKVGMNGAKH